MTWGHLQNETSKEKELMKLLAFTARYGHQDVRSLKRMPITEFMAFANALGELLLEEAEAVKRSTDS